MSSLLLIDTGNLLFCTNKKYKRRLDYSSYFEFVEQQCGTVDRAIAFVAKIGTEADAFIEYIGGLGFEIRTKTPIKLKRKTLDGKKQYPYYRTIWTVEIVMEALGSGADKIILGTNDLALLPFVEIAEPKMIASLIPPQYKKLGAIEIPEELLLT